MNEAVLDLLERAPLSHGFLIFLRISAVFFFLPIFGSTSVPMRVRLGLVLGCVLILIPLVQDPVQGPRETSQFLSAAAAEVLIGLMVGFSCRGLFWILQLSGTMAAQAISLSQILGNQIEQPAPALAQIVYVAALALAALLKFHVLVIMSLAQSYEALPLGQSIPDQMAVALSINTVSKLFYVAFGMAGPFLIIAVLYNLCLGVVNKAMPQLMVAFVGAPAITWLGMVVLLLAAPVILTTWQQHLMALSLFDGGR